MELAIRIDGKKFMWDGFEYEKKEDAEKKVNEYKEKGFEVKVIEREGKFYVYTRRVAVLEENKK